MPKGLIPLGVRCRQHRDKLGLRMADQAKSFGCSVSQISAIERGARPIPKDYAAKFAEWLNLSPSETLELEALAKGEIRSIQLFPANEERAQLAFDFEHALNDLSLDQVRKLRSFLKDKPRRYTTDDLRRWAWLARLCFNLGNKLTVDLLDIVENKLAFIDPEYALEVVPDAALGDQASAYAESARGLVQKIAFSEHVYEAVSQKKPEAQILAAHELAHWLFHSGPQKYSRRLNHIEREANAFAIEFLMPPSIVQRFSTPGQLAMACNVPLGDARARMAQLDAASRGSERERVSAGLSQLLTDLRASNSNNTGSSIALSDDRVAEWFKQFGWR